MAVAWVALSGCAGVSERYDARARALGFDVTDVAGTTFSHRVYRHVGPSPRHVRVYFEGDGTPWIDGHAIAADPTPRRPFALALMARDAGDVLLVGRPCYHGVAPLPACEPSHWTAGRYGEDVVESMAAALASVLACCVDATVTLVGYSGGGVLARLLAARTNRVGRVLTVAANLDVEAWTRYHGYLPLTHSLDPARLPETQPSFEEIHLAGDRDRNVPPTIVQSYARTRPWVRVERFDRYDHVCCWVDAWPGLLTRFDP